MAYTLTFALSLGAGQTGLTLGARLIDTAGSNVGDEITSGFVEVGLGNYLWTGTAIPDGHRGGVKFAIAGGGALKAIAAINPEEGERIDTKVSLALDVAIEAGISASANLVNDTGTQLTAINARQALAAILSACAAALSGADTGSIAIKPAGKPAASDRVALTGDASGNRSSITLRVPD